MGYGDRWTRATAAAREAIGRIGPADRASVVFFASGADVALRSTPDRSRLNAAVATGKPGSGATRYGPALKLAGSIASESALPRREVILISDFQRVGWQGAEGVRLPDGVTLTATADCRCGDVEPERHAGLAAALDVLGAGSRHRDRRRHESRRQSGLERRDDPRDRWPRRTDASTSRSSPTAPHR